MRIRELVPWRSQGERRDLARQSRDPFGALQTEMHRLFDNFFEGFDGGSFDRNAGLTLPQVDVAETDDAVHVTADLPGMSESDLDVTLSDGSLVIRGEK